MAIKILGTSHISRQSIVQIRQEIQENKPDLVALELDVQRAVALTSKEKRRLGLKEVFQIGIKGYLFAKIGQIVQQKLGNMVGVKPGSEMKAALLLAHKHDIQIALIDQRIEVTLRNFSKALTWKERFRFVWEIITSLLFPRRRAKELGLEGVQSLDLSKVPAEEVIEKMIGALKKNYPSIYKTIIDDRNRYMVKRLKYLQNKYPDYNILAIVGAGHKKEMERLLSD